MAVTFMFLPMLARYQNDVMFFLFSTNYMQIITLLHTVANHPVMKLNKFLVVAPLNTVYNWETEFEKWLELDERMDVSIAIQASVIGFTRCYKYCFILVLKLFVHYIAQNTDFV